VAQANQSRNFFQILQNICSIDPIVCHVCGN